MSRYSEGIGSRLGGKLTWNLVMLFVVTILVTSMASAGLTSAAVSRTPSPPAVPAPWSTPNAGGTTLVLQQANVAFTGDVQTDFSGDLLYHNYNTTQWGANNNITGLYAAYNSTELFLGLNATADGNSVMFFLSNSTNSGLGTTNLSNYPAWTGHSINFTTPINYEAAVAVSGANTGPSGQQAARITSNVSSSGTINQTDVAINNSWDIATSGYELAINWSGLFPAGITGPVDLMLSAFVAGGGAWLGMGAPYLQAGAYNAGGSQPYFLVNDTFSIEAPEVVHTFMLNDENVALTGNVPTDFSGDLLYAQYNTTPWGANNNITGLYAAYNATDLFIGLNATADGNSIMIFLSNDTSSGLGTSNITGLSLWGGHDINFTSPINYEAAVYSATLNSNQSGATAGRVTSNATASVSNSTNQDYVLIPNTWAYGPSGYEVALAWTGLYPSGIDGPAGLHLSALVAGGGAWVGMGAPFPQEGQYNNGGSQVNFVLNDTLSILAPNLDVATSHAPPTYPISVDLIFNDHQPFYQSIDSTTAYLPWTVVHLEEYAEQAIIAGANPSVNVTYSLSGSLLYQIEAIAGGYYNNSYLQAAYIPQSQWGNSVYTEISTHGDSFLGSLVGSPQWNSTNVSQVLEFDLAFNTPLWVYSANTPASVLYNTLFNIEQSQLKNQTTMSPTDLTDALVEFFLWSASYPIISGQLGSSYRNSTMLTLYNQSSFSISDLAIIAAYYPVEAQLTLTSFEADRMLNDNTGGNVELLTTPFDHPILPLLLLNNYTGQTGDAVVKGVWGNDTTAQLNVGRDLYDQIFGQYPTGLWSPEQAVSSAVVPYINASGYTWTSSSQNTLSAAGVNSGQGVATPNATQLEALYTPYRVLGANGTSTVMVYRDEAISNDWGFNYAGIAESGGSWAAVDTFMSSLKNVFATIPTNGHNDTIVTVALDGENWMFGGPFPEDAVPFLQDLYTSLAQNSSWVRATTVQQYMASHPILPTLSNLPIGSWNSEPTGNGVNQYLGQWAGHAPQDSLWQQLTLVRSEVQSYGATNGLVQPTNVSGFTSYNNFPNLSSWTVTTPQGEYAEAWMAIYLAEASDITFSMDTGDQSLGAQNALVFENELRADLGQALTVLGLPLTPFLASSYQPPVSPTVWGTNSSVSPVLTGSLITTGAFAGGTGYSVNANNAWSGAFEAASGATTQGSGVINATYYAFDANNLYFSVGVNGATSAYKAPNFFTPSTDSLDVFFSPVNPGAGDLQGLAIPNSAFTVGTTPFGFASTTEATIQGSSVTPSGSATMDLYQTTNAAGSWTYDTSVAGDAFVGGYLQLQVPLGDLGMVPGDSIAFFVAAVNSTTGAAVSSIGPLIVTVPAALAVLTLISTIHNTAPSDGPGTYTYPTEAIAGVPDYPPGSADMQWVNVSTNSYIAEFNITFGNLSNVFNGPNGFSQPIIDIYVHEPGASGKTAGLPGVNINLSAASDWAYVIQAAGWSANSYVESAAGVSSSTAVLVGSNMPANGTLTADRTVSIQVPTSVIGSAIPTYTYTIVCGIQDGYATNGWDVVNPTTGAYQGGGAKALDAPYVYSYIAPAMVGSNPALTQEDLLSNYTNTSYPTLVAIALPLLNVTTTSTVALGDSAVVGTASGDSAFYSFGSEVFTSTSTSGSIWSAPTAWFNLSWTPTGLAAVGGTTPGWVAWNGSNYAFENLVTDTFANGTLAGGIYSAALTYANGAFYLALVGLLGTISIVNPGSATVLGSSAVGTAAVGLSTASSGTTYIAEYVATGVVVTTISLSAGAASFGSSDVLSTALLSNAEGPDTVSGIAVAGGPTGGVAVAVAAKNLTGTDIYIANGTGVATLRLVAADGTDYSPSLVVGSGATAPPVYLGFTDLGGAGNVFFIPTSVATLSSSPATKTTPTPGGSSNAIPSWVWIAIAVVVIVIILVAVAALMRRPKEPSSTTTTGTGSTSGTSSSEGGDSGSGAALPPDGS